jgi:hypothetical protein
MACAKWSTVARFLRGGSAESAVAAAGGDERLGLPLPWTAGAAAVGPMYALACSRVRGRIA